MSQTRPQPDFTAQLIEAFLSPEIYRMAQLFRKLLDENGKRGRSSATFIHGGEVLSLLPINKARQQAIEPIHPDLAKTADYFLFLRNEHIVDVRKLTQGIKLVLSRCQSDADIRDALPEILAKEVPEFRAMPRTRPEGFVFAGHPMLERQFELLQEYLMKHVANRLLTNYQI